MTTENNKVLEEKINQISHDVSEIKLYLTGGSDSAKGLLIRVDRLEQEGGKRSWIGRNTIAAFIAAIVTLLVKALWR